jgi:hypothetical protein
MKKYIIASAVLIGLFSITFFRVSAQEEPILTAVLDSQTPIAQSLQAGAQYAEVARITLSATGGDVYLDGISLATDVSGGLSNFTDIYIYDTYDSSLLGTYPNQSASPNLIRFGVVVIGNGKSETYLIKASLAPSAAGNVRVGFNGFTFTTLAVPTYSGVPIYGNVMTLPGVVATPTPLPSPSLTPTPSATPIPSPTPITISTPVSRGFTSLTALGLTDGDTISAVSLPAQSGSNDPDIYIVNSWGYRRLFLNPIIFSFYGHLGGFAKVKTVASTVKDVTITSGLFRNCETNDTKVYGLETTGEDTGVLHWVNTSGAQAVQDDPDFFNKVFCINTNEFNWYSKGLDYASINQVPSYSR